MWLRDRVLGEGGSPTELPALKVVPPNRFGAQDLRSEPARLLRTQAVFSN